jgi:AcrR family transcriptional regulator
VFRSKYEVSEAILLSKVTPEQFKCRRDLILAAATRVFARSGCAQATMQDVAVEAGLSVGAIYRYYPGKEQLVRAVFDRIGESTRSLFGRAAEAAESPADILRNAGRVILERFKEEPTREETIVGHTCFLPSAFSGKRRNWGRSTRPSMPTALRCCSSRSWLVFTCSAWK